MSATDISYTTDYCFGSRFYKFAPFDGLQLSPIQPRQISLEADRPDFSSTDRHLTTLRRTYRLLCMGLRYSNEEFRFINVLGGSSSYLVAKMIERGLSRSKNEIGYPSTLCIQNLYREWNHKGDNHQRSTARIQDYAYINSINDARRCISNSEMVILYFHPLRRDSFLFIKDCIRALQATKNADNDSLELHDFTSYFGGKWQETTSCYHYTVQRRTNRTFATLPIVIIEMFCDSVIGKGDIDNCTKTDMRSVTVNEVRELAATIDAPLLTVDMQDQNSVEAAFCSVWDEYERIDSKTRLGDVYIGRKDERSNLSWTSWFTSWFYHAADADDAVDDRFKVDPKRHF